MLQLRRAERRRPFRRRRWPSTATPDRDEGGKPPERAPRVVQPLGGPCDADPERKAVDNQACGVRTDAEERADQRKEDRSTRLGRPTGPPPGWRDLLRLARPRGSKNIEEPSDRACSSPRFEPAFERGECRCLRSQILRTGRRAAKSARNPGEFAAPAQANSRITAATASYLRL